jgi:hypothetical protein
VFAAGPDTFLGIHRPGIITGTGIQKYILELIHTGIGE